MVRRVTTNGTMYSYKSTLQRTYRGLNAASNKVITNRQFNSYSEDPAAATKAFQLRRARWNTEAQMASNDRVAGKFSQGWDTLDEVYDKLTNELGNFSALRGSSDPTASGRRALGQSMIATAESIVFSMNSKYTDEYIFAGADGMNAPFAWDTDGDLTYRGIKVDLDPKDPSLQPQKAEYSIDITSLNLQAGDEIQFDGEGAIIQTDGDVDATMNNFVTAYNAKAGKEYEASYKDGKFTLKALKDGAVQNAPVSNVRRDTETTYSSVTVNEDVEGQDDKTAEAREAQEALKAMLGETTFVDLGMGFEEDENTGKIIPATAFNQALCGLKYLGGSDAQTAAGEPYGGYGKDSDGDPLNIISIIKKTGELLYNCDQDSGAWAEDGDPAWGVKDPETGEINEYAAVRDIDRLIEKLQNAMGKVSVTHVDLDTEVAFLDSNKERLKELDDTLNNQIVGVEDMDPADAITSLMWAQYSYNAALKIGNGILSQSLLDYLS